jgi:hypothetical protein
LAATDLLPAVNGFFKQNSALPQLPAIPAPKTLLASAKAHPVLSVLAVAGGIAGLVLLANPATRKAAIAGGLTLWKTYGGKLTPNA